MRNWVCGVHMTYYNKVLNKIISTMKHVKLKSTVINIDDSLIVPHGDDNLIGSTGGDNLIVSTGGDCFVDYTNYDDLVYQLKLNHENIFMKCTEMPAPIGGL
jgi:hypothetical protein